MNSHAPATILIVEDDPVMLRGLRDNFEYSGYVVRTATDGESGLELALSLRPDLLILDVMMPKMNGYELCHMLRERQIDSPILMLTAKGQESDIVMGLKLGADDYVTKPFSIREVLARVESMLRRVRANRSVEQSFGPFTLQRDAHELYRDGKPVQLSPKEFRLLLFFLDHPGRVYTREAILNQVWGHDAYVTERSVDRFVTTLRNKIETDPRHPQFLRTVRQVGYKFVVDQQSSNGASGARM